MIPTLMSTHIRKARRWLAGQLVNDLSTMLPPMIAGEIAAQMGMTSTFGPPIKRNSLGDSSVLLGSWNADVPANALALDLGCGRCPKNPFGVTDIYGIDLQENLELNVHSCDLTCEPIPFPSEQFNCVTAHDLIEHIPRIVVTDRGTRFPFVQLMNEIYRVLKPGGYFFSQTPAYPSVEAFQDPTHVNYITMRTFPVYFCRGELNPIPLAKMYGFSGMFILVGQVTEGWMFTLLRKV